jgi:DNA sulfur modification protein DndE
MKFNRIILDENVTKKLAILKGRIGLTPNILCRFGLILSLKDMTLPNPLIYKQNGQELMRHVLLGEYDTILVALFIQRASKDSLDMSDNKMLIDYFRTHINRGSEMLFNRVKKLLDLGKIIC